MTQPDDDTQPHASEPLPAGGAVPPPPPPPAPDAPPTQPGPTAPPPPLTAKPDRPADPGWREPPWIPPRPRDHRPSLAALLVGLGLIGLGVWFFLKDTLGVSLPALDWRSLWPIILIVVGGLVLIRSLDRRS